MTLPALHPSFIPFVNTMRSTPTSASLLNPHRSACEQWLHVHHRACWVPCHTVGNDVVSGSQSVASCSQGVIERKGQLGMGELPRARDGAVLEGGAASSTRARLARDKARANARVYVSLLAR